MDAVRKSMYVSMAMQENIAQKDAIKVMIVKQNMNPMRRMKRIKRGGHETMPFVMIMKRVVGVRNIPSPVRTVNTIIYAIVIKTKVAISGRCCILPFHVTMNAFN
jgi:hypothetical protein